VIARHAVHRAASRENEQISGGDCIGQRLDGISPSLLTI
jgi:hypothetical protein